MTIINSTHAYANVISRKSRFLFAYLVAAALTPALLLSVASAWADETFAPKAAIALSGAPLVSFDISWVDPVTGLYLLADRSHASLDVVDTSTNTLLFQVPGFVGFKGTNETSGPNGVLTVNHVEAWAGDGDSTIKIINLISHAITDTLNTGGKMRADELCWDPRDRVVLMANDADDPPFVTFWSTTPDHAFLGKIVFDGKAGNGPKATDGIEQCQWDRRTGKFYLNLPEVNGPGNDSAPGNVVVISPKNLKIQRAVALPIDQCAGPHGMAIGPDQQILLGCNASSSSVIIDEHNLHVIAAPADTGGSDEVWFNDGDDHYFLANSSAIPPNLGVVDADSHAVDSSTTTNTIVTGKSAHSVAADPVMNQVYVPIRAGTSTLCGQNGGSNAQGCIIVFTATSDSDDQNDETAQEAKNGDQDRK